MTRADINIVLPNGKVLHWYHNGDQYPDGIRDYYGLNVLIYNLYEGASYPEYNGELLDETVERMVQAYYTFAYAKLIEQAPLKKVNKVVDNHEDYTYIIDLMNKQVTVENWGKVIFQTKGRADKGNYLIDAMHFLNDWYEGNEEREMIDLALDEAELARTNDNRHEVIKKIKQLDMSNLRVTARTAADIIAKEQRAAKDISYTS